MEQQDEGTWRMRLDNGFTRQASVPKQADVDFTLRVAPRQYNGCVCVCVGGGGGDIDNRLDLVEEFYSALFILSFYTDSTILHQFSTPHDFHSPIVDVE